MRAWASLLRIAASAALASADPSGAELRIQSRPEGCSALLRTLSKKYDGDGFDENQHVEQQ